MVISNPLKKLKKALPEKNEKFMIPLRLHDNFMTEWKGGGGSVVWHIKGSFSLEGLGEAKGGRWQ